LLQNITSLFVKIPQMSLNSKSITRLSFEKTLIPLLKNTRQGIILDVGAKNSPYLPFIKHSKYLRLDISNKNHPDIVCDLHKIEWQDNYFDTIIATEVLEHLYDPRQALDEILRIMKPGGKLFITTRFIYKYHPDPKDFYRYTKDSLAYLLKKFSNVKIYPHGNRLLVLWQFLCSGKLEYILTPLNPLVNLLNTPDPLFPLGYVVTAKK